LTFLERDGILSFRPFFRVNQIIETGDLDAGNAKKTPEKFPINTRPLSGEKMVIYGTVDDTPNSIWDGTPIILKSFSLFSIIKERDGFPPMAAGMRRPPHHATHGRGPRGHPLAREPESIPYLISFYPISQANR